MQMYSPANQRQEVDQRQEVKYTATEWSEEADEQREKNNVSSADVENRGGVTHSSYSFPGFPSSLCRFSSWSVLLSGKFGPRFGPCCDWCSTSLAPKCSVKSKSKYHISSLPSWKQNVAANDITNLRGPHLSAGVQPPFLNESQSLPVFALLLSPCAVVHFFREDNPALTSASV